MDLFDVLFHSFPLKWETFDKSAVLYAWSRIYTVLRCEMPWPRIWNLLHKFLWTERYRLCPEEHPDYTNCYKPSAQLKKIKLQLGAIKLPKSSWKVEFIYTDAFLHMA